MTTIRHTRLAPPGLVPGGDDALARLLADAAPPHDLSREFRGEDGAVTAFREARRAAVSPFRKRSLDARRLLVVKSVIVLAALSGGGVAFAAVTGHLPGRPGGHPPTPSSVAPSVIPSAVTGPGHPSRPGTRAPGPAASRAGAPAARPAGRPSAGTGASGATGGSGASGGSEPAVLPSVPPARVPGIGVPGAGVSAGPVRVPAPPSLPVRAPLSPAAKAALPSGASSGVP